jgi:hypothetical protein
MVSLDVGRAIRPVVVAQCTVDLTEPERDFIDRAYPNAMQYLPHLMRREGRRARSTPRKCGRLARAWRKLSNGRAILLRTRTETRPRTERPVRVCYLRKRCRGGGI